MSQEAASLRLAPPRTFLTVKGALLWYRDQLATRLRVNRDPASVGTPRSQYSIDEAQATFAAVANCLKRSHPTDPEDEDELAQVRFRVTGEMQTWLICWYDSDGWGDGTWLGKKAGFEGHNAGRMMRSRCLKTERVIRRRLEWAGLLEEE